MTPGEYMAAQARVQLLTQLILSTSAEDLDGLIQSAEHADTMGPFLDPTAWQAGHATLRLVIENARTLRHAQGEIRKAAERAGVVVP